MSTVAGHSSARRLTTKQRTTTARPASRGAHTRNPRRVEEPREQGIMARLRAAWRDGARMSRAIDDAREAAWMAAGARGHRLW
ncbi:hypothetical protein [Sinomonas sp. ASV322]|uniref:hypothetical protein n=1 Tax=Sinomonas sp. ASV322 TaxID=3041920 RepID=UPI0027DCFBC6|nr:hypothetical protein [Sinomonas sp. ASV322]MDQ4503489.1 hypothetical protein [Sinomonas sp. ASV322]